MRILRRYLFPIVIVPVMAVTACSTATINFAHNATAGSYRDNAGWSIAFPRNWHFVRFVAANGRARAVGIQLSNVRLPRPQLVPRSPIQVSGEVLPKRGIGLIIAQDSDKRLDRSGWLADGELPRRRTIHAGAVVPGAWRGPCRDREDSNRCNAARPGRAGQDRAIHPDRACDVRLSQSGTRRATWLSSGAAWVSAAQGSAEAPVPGIAGSHRGTRRA